MGANKTKPKTNSCLTIGRLCSLRPGKTMTVYKGDFDIDLGRAGAPTYKSQLRRIHDVMRQLESAGRIVLHIEHEAIGAPGDKSCTTYKRYVATGI